MALIKIVLAVMSMAAVQVNSQISPLQGSSTIEYAWTRNVTGTVVRETATADEDRHSVVISSVDDALPEAGYYRAHVILDFVGSEAMMAYKLINGPHSCFLVNVTGLITYTDLKTLLSARNNTVVVEETVDSYDGTGRALNFGESLSFGFTYPVIGANCFLWKFITIEPLEGSFNPADVVITALGFDDYVQIAVTPYLGGPNPGAVGPQIPQATFT